MFGPDDLKNLVECAGKALEAEDRYLVAGAAVRGWRARRSPPGIRGNINERYYQFVIWRALWSSFRWRTETERGSYDLAFCDDVTDQRVAVAEIKGEWSENLKYNVEGIRWDIEQKLAVAGMPGVMLIYTGQYCSDHETYLSGLAEKLGVERSRFATYTFDVAPWPGKPNKTEFMFIGFFAKLAAAAITA